ncbi:MAG TPA: hypothetical protein VH762_05840 [Gemmatimonadaceae bacterium]|jgi:hypothetical protein
MTDRVSPSPAVDDDFRELVERAIARAEVIATTSGHPHQAEAQAIVNHLRAMSRAHAEDQLDWEVVR